MTPNANNPNKPDVGPPTVPSIDGDHIRPYWSVMIPTFNCARYLRETLASVWSQDPGPDVMQIEVVDDCSTKDDPESVVREVGGGRISFYRQPRNQGLTGNWNTCLARARGHWVHLLHGDDLVQPGFYQTMRDAADRHPDLAMLFCRAFTINEQGEIETISPRVREMEQGTRQFPPMHLENPVRTPTVVIRRDFYESHGGFDPRFAHTADWEMWMRATVRGGALCINRPLASYRLFAANHSGQLARTAGNLEEYVSLAKLVEEEGRTTIDWRQFRRMLAACASAQARAFAASGDREAADANWRFWRGTATWRIRIEHWAKQALGRSS